MDKFFSSLLEQKFYGDLLKEHLEGYVEEVVRKKYHILKTSDNFYRYKTDIKIWLQEIRERQQLEPENLELVNQIDRGFDDIEHRIANMDREHTRYVRATVTRLNYLLSQEEDMRGMVVQILNGIAEDPDRRLKQTAEKLNFSHVDVLSEKSLYKRKKGRRAFLETLEADEEVTELSREDVLRLNRMKNRYSRQQIEAFIEEHMKDGKAEVTESFVSDEESFEKLILAYDYAGKKGSLYQVEESGEMIDNGAYRYPKIVFRRRRRNNMGGNE
jgi:hypothetical protein